jgi:REP element-mobilizing transposase RayT
MSTIRVKQNVTGHSAFYALTSRVTGGSFIFHDAEKQVLKDLLFTSEKRFCWKIHDYVFMSNHWHVVAEILPISAVSDEMLLERYRFQVDSQARSFPDDETKDIFRQKAHDLSYIVGNFEQRFSQWYNRTHGRLGALVGARFDSEILRTGAEIMKTMAYISMNPVRAKIVKDPKDFHYCGYAERLAGGPISRDDARLFEILKQDLGADPQHSMLADRIKRKFFVDIFRAYLLGIPFEKGGTWNQQTLGQFLQEAGCKAKLSWNDKLIHRCTYYRKSIAVGSYAFIQKMIHEHGHKMKWTRPHQPYTQKEWDEIHTLKARRKGWHGT